ncbi:transporter substrate-binding domain-containing protein [Bosea sp. 2KB_26]|uniref:transporter substrate-binding domain-containing protein n=1 Tax=Bosea sp. 2KB_26 TaxID=3237475 RepID=UPI003F9154BB
MRLLDRVGPPPEGLIELLAPSGTLRAAINLSNFLLVSGRTPEGGPVGVAPDMARALADLLGVGLCYVTYESPGLIADAADRDEWDIALIGVEPQRAEFISFTPAYTEIEASYLVPEGSPLQHIGDVDAPGRRIAVTDRTAYGLWLDRNIAQATLVRTKTIADAASVFREGKLDALAGLLPRLVTDQKAIPGSRILPGRYMAVQQAVGTPTKNAVAIDYIKRFVAIAISSGFVAGLIDKHGVEGLTVARDQG